ncbi:Dihydroorotate dehydrogenase class 2 [Trinorchestia longiramus]|nr:Dihydroorotate dehydrogenase class 2 [Trinorchestia longiramus]
MKDLIYIGSGGAMCFTGILYYTNDPKLHRNITVPLLHALDPEQSHRLSIWAMKHKLLPRRRDTPDPSLRTSILGLQCCSPIGLAAGYDKDGEAVEGLFRLGFGFVEVGSVTPKPQEGNPKPRVFRLSEDEAVINRYGFNSAGHAQVYDNLSRLPPPGKREAPVGINLGKNKTTQDHVADYKEGVRLLAPLADYLVINVSSPNTPGLRGLQAGGALSELLEGVQAQLQQQQQLGHRPPLLVKIAPDLSETELSVICKVLLEKKVDGIIVGNTTVSRPPGLRSSHAQEVGGLSGKPLEDKATSTVRTVASITKGRLPIIGCGGISDGEGAYAKLRAGASAVQLYTALVFGGPTLVGDIEKQLLQLMKRDGFSCVSEVVGSDLRSN